MNLGLEGDCSIDSKGGPQKERPQRPYKILGMSAKFGSLQGGRRVQCSSDRNDDIVLSEVASMASAAFTEWPLSGLGLSYIASEKNHDEIRYSIY